MQRGPDTTPRWTIANALCVLRLTGCPVLLYLAYHGHATAFVSLFVFLVLTDWVDGKLARWLGQRSAFGAQLDTWADIALYGCLLLSAGWLVPEALRREWPWVAVALGAYAGSVTVAMIRFGRWPAYHTRSAKICWLLIFVGVVFLFAGWSAWPMRIAMIGATLANLEAMAITLMLPHWRTDVSSAFQIMRWGDGKHGV